MNIETMTDEEIGKIVNDIDEYFPVVINKYKLDPIIFFGILLARVVRVSQALGSEEDFSRLLDHSSASCREFAKKSSEKAPLH